MFNSQSLAANIKKYRKAKGLSQNALANALMVSPQSVSKWECGASSPDIENLCGISELLDVSLDVLLAHPRERKKIMIGIDGGGTKTEFIMFTEDGAILERFMAGTCNPNAIGIEACADMLIKGINNLLTVNSNVCGVYIGSAGFLLGNNVSEIRDTLKRHYPHIKIKCATDILNVAAGAVDSENSIIAICGTGSSVLVKEGEKLTLIGGWGYLLSKSGSGYDIGRDALHAAACDIDGLGEHTLITELVKARTGETVSDIVEKVYKNDQAYVASFATVVFEAYKKGDGVARGILFDNAESLAGVINHAASKYDCGNQVIISGGIVTKNPFFVEILRGFLNPSISMVIPKYPQVLGACVMCARMCGVKTDGLIDELVKQY